MRNIIIYGYYTSYTQPSRKYIIYYLMIYMLKTYTQVGTPREFRYNTRQSFD